MVKEVGERLVRDRVVASVTLGRDHCPSEEAYTALSYQACLELLVRIESFYAPLGSLASFHIIIAPVSKRTSNETIELSPNVSKQTIEDLQNRPFPS